jgi:hypothetical protein
VELTRSGIADHGKKNNQLAVCGAFYEPLGSGDSLVWSIDGRGDCAVHALAVVNARSRLT